ncbi:MAG: hypothetical protein KTR31_14825 [Myxococcales bacterium]|nr:hypothetical protein [Myxococcales bacterium]
MSEMGAPQVEELFGEGGGTPKPRLGLVMALLTSGMLLALMGLACSSAPGGALVLVAWVVVEKERDRIDSGYLPSDVRPAVDRLRRVTWASVVSVVMLFTAQFLLMMIGFYTPIWRAVIVWLGGVADVIELMLAPAGA